MNIIAALIAAGADVNCEDQDGNRPLHYLSETRDKPDVMHYLAKKGAEIISLPYSKRLTLLYLTCKNDFVGNLEFLISLGVLAGVFLWNLRTEALDAAIRHRSSKLLEAFSRYGFIPDPHWNDGFVGLHRFVLTYHITSSRDRAADKRILRLLLEHTDLLAKDQSGHTLLSRLFRLQEISEKEDLELAALFLKSLPEHKVFEAYTQRLMIRSQHTEDVEENMSRRSERAAAIVAENTLGWN